MRHLIDFGDLSRAEWEALYQRTSAIIDHPADFMDACRGRLEREQCPPRRLSVRLEATVNGDPLF